MSSLSPKELDNLKILLLSLESTNWEIAIEILIAHKNKLVVDQDFLSFTWGIIVFKESKMQQQELWQVKRHLTALIQIWDQDFYKKTKHLASDFRIFTSKFGREPERLYRKLSTIIDNSPLTVKSFLFIPLKKQSSSAFIYSWQCRFMLERGLFSLEEFQQIFIGNDYLSNKNKLHLARFPLEAIPKKYLDKLPVLQITNLSIACNELKELPSAFYLLTELEYLDIRQNPIKQFAVHSNTWKKLITLVIYRCKQLQELPNTLIQTAPLQHLEMDSCQLKTFPTVVLSAKKLNTLSLAGNKFSTIPLKIEQLQELKTLDLDNNIYLKELPYTITQLQQLEQLKLSNCALRTLPDNFGNLKNLKELRLANNHLQELPESFFELENLEKLSISNNLIPLTKDFLDRLLQLPSLRYLLLEKLPITPKIYKEYYNPILKPRFKELYIRDPQK